MKHLTVIIRTELEIPDSWEVVDHACGVQGLKIGDNFVAFDVTPYATASAAPHADWSDASTPLIESVIDAVVHSEAELTVRMQH